MSYVHVSGWLQVSEPNGPTDPGFGRPGGGWSPADPGYGHPGWGPVDPGFGSGGGLHPSHGLPGGGYPSHGLPIAPGYPGNKPPGRPIIPVDPGQRPPMGGAPPHPWVPGHWEPVDPGWGKPPLWGFIPVDPGWGIDEGLAPGQGLPGGGIPPKPDQGLPGGGAPPRPDQGLPGGVPPASTKPPVGPSHPIAGPSGGWWVPVDPDYGLPERCPGGGKPHPPIWAWIPQPPDLSKPIELPPETAQPK